VTDHKLIEDKINQVVCSLQDNRHDVFDPHFIAARVDELIDPDRVAPPLTRYTSIVALREMARRVLAHQFDPVSKAMDHVANETGDLFSGELQDHYPVKRVLEGENRQVYIHRDQLTETDVQRITARMIKASDSLRLHAQALKACFKSKASVGQL